MQLSKTRNEALEANFEAAELCMRALKVTSDQSKRKLLQDRCRVLLDQAERHKHVEESSRPLESCKKDVHVVKPGPTVLESPRSTRALSTREQIILLEGSKLHGSIFPPWRRDPDPHEFDLREGDAQYV